MLEDSGAKDMIVSSWPAAYGHDRFNERQQCQQATRQQAHTYESKHFSNLSDAIIVPPLISGHPQIAVSGIGEKVADLLVATSRLGNV